MKQLETRNPQFFETIMSFYKEIGIDIFITNKKIDDKTFFKTKKKKNHDKFIDDKFLINSKKDPDEIQNKETKIIELEYLFKNFDSCGLKKTSTNFVKFIGNINSKIIIIDGPPDIEEDRTGISFISAKGELLEKMLNAIKLTKNDVFIVKSIPWRPPGNRYPTLEEIKICRPFIINLINLIEPKIIVCLGEVPINQILELDQSILKLRGKWRSLQSKKTQGSDGINYQISVLSTLSISHLLERPDLKKFAWEDMKLLRDKIKEIS